MQGHNKDGHPSDPQVVIATECTTAGYVLRHRTFAGNANDMTIAKDLVAKLAPPKKGQMRVWVSDAGMMSKQLMKTLDEAKWHRLSAEGPRKSTLGQLLLSETKGRFITHSEKPHMTYKVKNFDAADTGTDRPERWVATRNEKERERRLEKIEEHIDEVATQLAKQRNDTLCHPKAVCKVAGHVSLGRLVKPSEKVTGTYILDQDAIRKERMLAGVRFYRTTLLDWDAEQILASYEALQQGEANHKLMKGPLRLRPCYQRVTERIEAHIMLTIVAANCVRFLERRTGKTFKELTDLFKFVKATEFASGDDRYWQRTEFTVAQQEVLEILGSRELPTKWDISLEKQIRRSKPQKARPTSRKSK